MRKRSNPHYNWEIVIQQLKGLVLFTDLKLGIYMKALDGILLSLLFCRFLKIFIKFVIITYY